MKATAKILTGLFNPEITAIKQTMIEVGTNLDKAIDKAEKDLNTFNSDYDLLAITSEMTKAINRDIYITITMANARIFSITEPTQKTMVKLEQVVTELEQTYKSLHLRLVTDETLAKVKSKTDKVSITDLTLVEVKDLLVKVKAKMEVLRAIFFQIKDVQKQISAMFNQYIQLERMINLTGASDNQVLNQPYQEGQL